MEELKKIEEILLKWKEQAIFEKDATIDYENRTVRLTIVSSKSRVGVFTDCEAHEKNVFMQLTY